MKCPFCGSEDEMIETPFIDRVTGEKKLSFCCPKQAKNREYIDKRFSKTHGRVPTLEEVAKL